jgi:hypothetical protein
MNQQVATAIAHLQMAYHLLVGVSDTREGRDMNLEESIDYIGFSLNYLGAVAGDDPSVPSSTLAYTNHPAQELVASQVNDGDENVSSVTIRLAAMEHYPLSSGLLNLGMAGEVILDVRSAEQLMAVAIDRVLGSIPRQPEETQAEQLALLVPYLQRQPRRRQWQEAITIAMSMLERHNSVAARVACLPLVERQLLWLNIAYEEAIRIESPVHRIKALSSLIPFLDVDRRRTAIEDMLTALEEGSYEGDPDDVRALALRNEIALAIRHVPQQGEYRHVCPSPALIRKAIQTTTRSISLTNLTTRAEIVEIFEDLLNEPAVYGTPIS